MSRRDYATSEVYSEHDREYRGPSRRGGGRTAELEEVEIRERRRNAPEFLHEDYGRREAGPLVIREDVSSDRPRRREVEEREELVIRERSRDPPRRREVIEDEVLVDRGPRRRDEVREEIVYRDRERTPLPPPQPLRSEREEFEYYRRDTERDRDPAPMPPIQPVRSEREVFEYRPVIREPTPEPERERTEITIKEKSRERPRYREERDEEIVIREKSRERPRYREERDEELIIRERSRERPRYREERDEEIIIRERERERERPRYRDDRDEEIIIRRDERSRERPRYRDERDEEIIIRDRERDRPRYRDERDEEIIIRERERERLRPREIERDSITIKTDERSRRGDFEESDALVIRSRSRANSRAPTRGDYREEDITIRERERERPRERSRSRERDDIVFRHDERGGRHTDQIMIRRSERSPSPEPYREPEPIRPPPVVQEVITHHRHIDHGFERAPEPPRPRTPSPVRDERIEIRHRGTSNGRHYDDDIIFERESGGRRHLEGVHRGRTEDEFAGALIRHPERDAVGPPVRYEAREPKKDRLWTEITKDLVAEQAIREKGYEYEEAETAWFVMQHLRYDDVLALVELTEDIRADRRDRISEMQAERDRPHRFRNGPPPQQWDEERVIEREIVYDSGRPGGRRIR